MRTNQQQDGRELQQLQQRMNRLFEGGESGAQLWAPVVDVTENENEIVLEAELPGMKKDEIDIQLNGDTLTLRGERQIEQSQKDEQYHRVERQYGAWQRSFQIEIPIDAQKVSADYESGVLTVRLPKAEEIKPRQIEIKS
jgi:HSP20 family protein